jgi:hypothetical protein
MGGCGNAVARKYFSALSLCPCRASEIGRREDRVGTGNGRRKLWTRYINTDHRITGDKILGESRYRIEWGINGPGCAVAEGVLPVKL